MKISQRLYKKAKGFIPGGTQLLSKRPEMVLPEHWPSYYRKAKGCEVWDLDGRKYIDMSYMGIGACILGYADEDVDGAVLESIRQGNMCTLNAPEEVELAELLIDLHPWAQMVRYARTGGEAMAVAVRIARAASGKDTVLFCGYHGWHDWYLAANLADRKSLDGHLLPGLNPAGVPRCLKGTSFPFRYNDTGGFLSLVRKHRKDLGVIVMESVRNELPAEEFLSAVMQVSKDLKAVLIVDEVSAGWRLNTGGAHLVLGFRPDLAVFAKGMSNGFPMAAIIGKRRIMGTAQETFISSTYWTDRIGPTAAVAAIRKMRELNVPEYLAGVGRRIQEGWISSAARHGVPIEVSGIYPLGHFSFQHKKALVLKTLFTQMMLERGFLASNAFYASYAHKRTHIAEYLEAVDDVLAKMAGIAERGNPEKYLKGPVCHSGFRRLA